MRVSLHGRWRSIRTAEQSQAQLIMKGPCGNRPRGGVCSFKCKLMPARDADGYNEGVLRVIGYTENKQGEARGPLRGLGRGLGRCRVPVSGHAAGDPG